MLALNGLGVTYMYGSKFLNKGALNLALENFRKATEYDSHFSEAHSNLAACYYELGDAKEATGIYERIINRDPGNVLGYYNLGLLYAFEKDYDNAIRCFKKALRLKPDFRECEEALVGIWQIIEGGTR